MDIDEKPRCWMTCPKCGEREEIELIRGAYIGSAFDYCSACDEPRTEEARASVLEFFRLTKGGKVRRPWRPLEVHGWWA